MSEMTKKAGKTSGVSKYVKEVKAELKKVTWPTLKQVRNNTLIVIAAIILMSAFIAVFDWLFGWGVAELINLKN